MIDGARGDLDIRLKAVVDRLAGEFVETSSRETVERIVHDSFQRLAAARTVAFIPVLAERLARDRLRGLSKLEDGGGGAIPGVLFLCVHNAGRSQMAAGWLKSLGGQRVLVYSGGSEPADELNPLAIEAMREVGIDISEEFPKPWTDEVVRAVDVIVTMGCGDACPIYPGVRHLDWELDDPAGRDMETVRCIRDEIRQRVHRLLIDLGVDVKE